MTTNRFNSLKKVAGALAIGAGIALSTTSCVFITPQATEIQYDPSHGVGATLGDVNVRNLIVFTEDGKTAQLAFVAVNNSGTTQKLNIQYAGSDGKPLTETLNLTKGYHSWGNQVLGSPQLLLNAGELKAGQLLEAYIQAGNDSGVKVEIPILKPSDWSFYKDYAPVAPVETVEEIAETPEQAAE